MALRPGRPGARRPTSSILFPVILTLFVVALLSLLATRSTPRGALSIAEECDVLYDGSGLRVEPAACASCKSPWLFSFEGRSKLCRCMVGCSPGRLRRASQQSQPEAWLERHDLEARAARGVQLVIGLGTGRSGTTTLSAVLRGQKGTKSTFTHELHPLLPWAANASQLRVLAQQRVNDLLRRAPGWQPGQANPQPWRLPPLVGDVASFYLPYVRPVLALEPGAKFVVVQRSRASVVASFLAKDPGVDLWSACAERSGWDQNNVYWSSAHPKFPCDASGVANATASLEAYWQLYADEVAQLEKEFPDRVKTWAVPQLFEDKRSLAEMLRRVLASLAFAHVAQLGLDAGGWGCHNHLWTEESAFTTAGRRDRMGKKRRAELGERGATPR